MTQTNRLKVSYIAPSQALKYVTINEGFKTIDRLSQISVVARDIGSQPDAPVNGDAYILPTSAVGEHWTAAADNALAFYDGGWHICDPQEGFQVWVESEQAAFVFSDGNWIALPVSTSPKFGVNAAPDNINRLTVKSDAELLTYDDVTPGTGDARKVINKKTAGHSASLTFQNDYLAKAELGLIGDDAFSIKTSSDGITFNPSLRVSVQEDKIDLFHPLKVNNSAVLSIADKPVFVANVASANTNYANDDLVDLSASLDTHHRFDSPKNAFIVPFTGVYFVQVGVVIRSVTSGVTIVKLRAFKNGTMGQSVSAVTADANITTVNDSSLLQFQAGDEISLRTTLNDAAGTVQFFPSSRLVIHRII